MESVNLLPQKPKYTMTSFDLAAIVCELKEKIVGFRIENIYHLNFSTLLLSGAIAGVAGMIELAGTTFRLSATISPGYGYIGFLIAALASFEPLAMLFVGFAYAAILNGGIALKTQGFSVNFVVAITGLILLLSAIGENLSHYRVIRRGPTAAGKQTPTQTHPEESSASSL